MQTEYPFVQCPDQQLVVRLKQLSRRLTHSSTKFERETLTTTEAENQKEQTKSTTPTLERPR